jgi:hypothetical protein
VERVARAERLDGRAAIERVPDDRVAGEREMRAHLVSIGAPDADLDE